MVDTLEAGRAAGSLAPVAGQVGAARRHAESGGLRIDLEAAERLLAKLASVRSRAGGLVKDGVELDHPLKFGDSWVGRLMSERLRGVAVDHEGGLSPVLRTFTRCSMISRPPCGSRPGCTGPPTTMPSPRYAPPPAGSGRER